MKSTNELTPAQKWEQATLADNFIFCKVMESNPDICKELLEILLGIEIERIEEPLAERSMKADFSSKGVRFDVYVKDGTGRGFDIEIQTANRKNLARRARYYQSLMDVDGLAYGTDYGELKDSYVIFLCLADSFSRGLPVYTFENQCREEKAFSMGDGAHKIFYNAAKYDIMPDEALRSFFRFLTGTDDGSPLSDRLARMVERAKTNAQWRHQFMTWEQEIRIRAREAAEEAAAEAREETAVETARKMMEESIPLETIARCTGLPLERVEQLRQESAVKA